MYIEDLKLEQGADFERDYMTMTVKITGPAEQIGEIVKQLHATMGSRQEIERIAIFLFANKKPRPY